jgi:ribonuclease D
VNRPPPAPAPAPAPVDPPPPAAPAGPPPDFTWVQHPDGLAAVAAALAGAAWVALDTESNSMFVYRERMCLLQLNAGGTLFVIDTLALAPAPGLDAAGEPVPSSALAPLRAQLERGDRRLYLHGGEYDVGVFKRDYGIQLGGIWDSQQAASFLGHERTGYGAVVERYCGISLDKGWAQYDWGTRPLDAAALRYAVDDVVFLPRIAAELEKDIAAAGLDEELALANAAVAETTWSGGFDPGGFWRIKGVRELAPHSLGILAALHAWRDAIARAADRPPGRMVNNETLLALARQAPTNYQLLKRIGVKGWLLSAHGEELIALIKANRSDPKPLPPRPRAREVLPIEEERERRLKDWRRAEAERRGVPLQVVLPARALEYLKQHGAGDLSAVPQLGAKRIALIGEHLRRLAE